MSLVSSQRAAVLICSAVLLASLSLALSPRTAHAGDYTVPYCIGLDGTPAQILPDFVPSATGQALVAYGCSSVDQGMQASLPANSPAGTYARYTVAADGAGMTIVGAGASGMYSPGDLGFSVGPLASLATCGTGPACFPPRPWSGSWAAPDSISERASLVFEARCDQPTCTGGELVIKRLAVTFRDRAAPTAGKVGGTLFNSSPGNPLSGVATVSAEAADTGSGARDFAVFVGGVEVARSKAQCDPPYVRQRACPAGLSDEVLVDTTKIPAGTHPLEIVASDASGNTTPISQGTVIVDNGAPKGPGADVNIRGAAIGSYDGDDANLDAWWPATGKSPSKKKTVRKRCKTKRYARAHKAACEGIAPKKTLTQAWGARTTSVLAGQVKGPDGRPVIGSRLDVLQTPTREGAVARPVSSATTDANGRFSVRVPVSSGSATFTIRRFARVRDDSPATTVAVRRSVRATTTFRVSDRSARRGQVITLSGRLKSRSAGLAGNAIAIQANPGGSWRAVTTVRTGASGRWTARYRVPRSLRGTYPFRATVVPSGGYPFARGVSATKRISVR